MSDTVPGLSAEDLISNRALLEEDTDDFGYTAISGRVAETILGLKPPLTLGLFGPWGSGKSSFCELLRRDLAERDGGVLLVKYDASTYGGEALKRNFISHIATQIGYKADKDSHSDFHRGLYESTRTTGLDFKAVRRSVGAALGLLALTMSGFLLISCLLVGIASVGTDESFLGQISATLPDLLAPSAIGGLILAVTQLLLKGATIEAEQSQPASDEAFAETFKRLVGKARKDGKFERLVVFVDELDRCSAEDVVATLTAIRTFLNQDHAVFVVAADRAALERALEEKLPQPTPLDIENPYYSSASSFFDKIFHDRVPLPPLRGSRLSQWAFEKVRGRGGYWKELRESEERALQRVLFFLIPSHVTSPRRVKVLLNGFVRNAAIAAHSGFDWTARAGEIAKLTAIDFEYPALGADLRIEPRLPGFLLEQPAAPSERVARLLAKHGADQISRGPGEDLEGPEEAEPSDAVLAQATEAQSRALAEAEHEQLRRYLARTRDIAIGRDLLFLDLAGAAFGIEDPELGALLDRAVDEPGPVIEALAGYEPETRRQAVRVLADMAEREFGEERRNAMSALAGAVGLLEDLDGIADELAGNLESYMRDEELDPGQLAGALRIAIAAPGYRRLRREILADQRLTEDRETLVGAAGLLDQIPADERGPIREALAAGVAGGGEELLGALRSLPGETGADLIAEEPVYGAIFRHIGPDAEAAGGGDDLAVSVFAIAAEKEKGGEALRAAIYRLLVREEIGYGPLRANAGEVLGALGEAERDLELMKILARFPGEETEHWSSQLSGGAHDSDEHGGYAAHIAKKTVEGVTFTSAKEVEAAEELIARLAPYLAMASEEERQGLVEALRVRLAEYVWWQDEETRARQEGAHRIGHLLGAESEELAGALEGMLAADLQRAPLGAAEIGEVSVRGIAAMGVELGAGAAALLGALPDAAQEGNPVPIWTARARLALALAAKEAGSAVEGEVVGAETMVEAAGADTEQGNGAVADWLALGPGAGEVARVLGALESRRTPLIEEGFEAWCKGASVGERTALARKLVGAEAWETRLLEVLVGHGVDEPALLGALAVAIREEGRGARRVELMEAIGRIAPVDPAAQRTVAELIVELASSDKQVDFKAAVKAIPGLGTEHRSAGRLREAFGEAAEKRGFQLNERAAKQLAEAKVKVSKKSVKKGVWGEIRDLFR